MGTSPEVPKGFESSLPCQAWDGPNTAVRGIAPFSAEPDAPFCRPSLRGERGLALLLVGFGPFQAACPGPARRRAEPEPRSPRRRAVASRRP